MGQYKFILSGGGTGGHIYPAIAIAYELKFRFPDAEFLYRTKWKCKKILNRFSN
jgi:UDP-N-acetylglucosamine--N-acetylmuramyl-(pentapeptide) pyrophosphoryl-undecaprenol N-acetylglucosamine transferase